MRWIAILFFLFLTACAPTTKDWDGKTTKSLFKNFGYPTSVARLRDGRCLLIYKRKDCVAMFKITRGNEVISVKYKGGKTCREYFS